MSPCMKASWRVCGAEDILDKTLLCNMLKAQPASRASSGGKKKFFGKCSDAHRGSHILERRKQSALRGEMDQFNAKPSKISTAIHPHSTQQTESRNRVKLRSVSSNNSRDKLRSVSFREQHKHCTQRQRREIGRYLMFSIQVVQEGANNLTPPFSNSMSRLRRRQVNKKKRKEKKNN